MHGLTSELKGLLEWSDKVEVGFYVLPPVTEVVDVGAEVLVAGSEVVAIDSTAPSLIEFFKSHLGIKKAVGMGESHSVQEALELHSESRDLPEPFLCDRLGGDKCQGVLAQSGRTRRTSKSERPGIWNPKGSLDLYSGLITGHRATFAAQTCLGRSVACDYAATSSRGVSRLHPGCGHSEAATSGRVRKDPSESKIHRASCHGDNLANGRYLSRAKHGEFEASG